MVLTDGLESSQLLLGDLQACVGCFSKGSEIAPGNVCRPEAVEFGCGNAV